MVALERNQEDTYEVMHLGSSAKINSDVIEEYQINSSYSGVTIQVYNGTQRFQLVVEESLVEDFSKYKATAQSPFYDVEEVGFFTFVPVCNYFRIKIIVQDGLSVDFDLKAWAY